MTRAETIATIIRALPSLDDERIDTLAAMLQCWSGGSIFETLPEAEQRKVDDALARLDRGEGIPAETVFQNLDAKLKAAGA